MRRILAGLALLTGFALSAAAQQSAPASPGQGPKKVLDEGYLFNIVDWDGGGWGVSALSVSDPRRWFDGSRVFSRNPLGSET